MQPLTVSTVQLLYTVKEKGGKPNRKPYPVLRNPENSVDYAQQNYTFMIRLQDYTLYSTLSVGYYMG